MKVFVWFLFILLALNFFSCTNSSNSSESKPIYLADPTIFYDNNMYYLYGTTGDPDFKNLEGFLVYTSRDLINWDGPSGISKGLALKKGDAFGSTGFWAPQVFKYQDMFYMAYTANEHIAMATSKSPLGPFKNEYMEDLKADVKQIDPFVFFDDDGKKYLYHVRLTEGNRIFVAELENDLMSIKPETLKECISVERPWENTQQVDWPVSEGPTVLKHKGLYYLIYSANDFRNPNYSVGYAYSKSPFGPWTKSNENPLIRREMLGIHGTGHGDVFFDKNAKMQYVFHTHFSNTAVHPRRTALINLDFSKNASEHVDLVINKSTFKFIEQ